MQIILEVSQERLLWDKSNSSEKTKTENGNGNFCKLSQSNIKYPMQFRKVFANQVSVSISLNSNYSKVRDKPSHSPVATTSITEKDDKV